MNNLNPNNSHSSFFENSNILVVGLGKTGVSVIEYLLNKDLSFRVIDTRTNPPNIEQFKNLDIEIILGGLFKEHFIWADTIILSPGISENEAVIKTARATGKIVVGDVELFLNEVNSPVVAITGSNGKSTVTSMMGSIGKFSDNRISIGGNIGIPALQLLEHESALYVLELSSFQLESINSINFETSVILNLTEDHMDRYDTFDDYCRAKLKLLNGTGNVILNFDDPVIKHYSDLISSKNKIKVLWFTLNEPSDNQYGIVDYNGSKWICVNQAGEIIQLLNCSELNLVGEHNISNAMVALIVSRLSNIENDAIKNGIAQFKGLPHRNQLIKTSRNVKWVNDSKATNVGATSVAISSLKDTSIILILGGQSKGQNFSILNNIISSNMKMIILFGEDAELINSELSDNTNRVVESNLTDVVQQANKIAVSGDVVLFSPACASFDMFTSFEHRGDSFVKLVEEITS